jgi:hypothetical protein
MTWRNNRRWASEPGFRICGSSILLLPVSVPEAARLRGLECVTPSKR